MRRLAIVLTWAGVATWLVGVVAWLLGVWVTLPPDAVRVLALGLVALTGGDLVVCGAVLGRMSRRHAAPGIANGTAPVAALGEDLVDAGSAPLHPSESGGARVVNRAT